MFFHEKYSVRCLYSLPVLIVLGIAGIEGYFMYGYFFQDTVTRNDLPGLYYPLIIGFTFLYGFALWSLLQTAWTDPGSPENSRSMSSETTPRHQTSEEIQSPVPSLADPVGSINKGRASKASDASECDLTPTKLDMSTLSDIDSESGITQHRVPQTQNLPKNRLLSVPLMERHCTACDRIKPVRTHHCQVCKRCIFRMDHHCPWMGNCIGFRNHKFFLLFNFYGGLTCFYIGVCFIARLIVLAKQDDGNETNEEPADSTIDIVALFLSFMFALFLLAMFAYHLSLLKDNTTTLETILFYGQKPFALSKDENLSQILGIARWKWWIPIQTSDRTSNGMNFPLARRARMGMPDGNRT
mmetsp:Transcript_49300/g.56630  ORF Transcript_49300/g.56630 Transcript_49300/m.56630 type:complete len:355 (+) Transcript_49300:27-1091(+)